MVIYSFCVISEVIFSIHSDSSTIILLVFFIKPEKSWEASNDVISLVVHLAAVDFDCILNLETCHK